MACHQRQKTLCAHGVLPLHIADAGKTFLKGARIDERDIASNRSPYAYRHNVTVTIPTDVQQLFGAWEGSYVSTKGAMRYIVILRGLDLVEVPNVREAVTGTALYHE